MQCFPAPLLINLIDCGIYSSKMPMKNIEKLLGIFQEKEKGKFRKCYTDKKRNFVSQLWK
jgi:hypothetical protein